MTGTEPDDTEDEEEGTSLLQWVRFALRAAKRRQRMTGAIALLGLTATVATAALWPRSYTTDTKITVERNALMPALADPHRSIPVDYDAPTKGAQDAIFARENLEKLVRETNLAQRWQETRPPILKAKDGVMSLFRAPMTDADRERALVAILEKQLHVVVESGSVSISVDWPDAQTAYDIVTTVQKNFLDARHGVEVNVIQEAIGILETHANEERDVVATSLAEIQRLNDLRAAAQRASAPRAGNATPSYHSGTTAPVATAGTTSSPNDDLLHALEAKRKAIKDIEDQRARKLNELNAQLADLRATLAPAHPQVIELERKIDAAREDPAELVTLRNEERELLGRIAAANDNKTPAPKPTVVTPPPIATVPVQIPPEVQTPNLPPNLDTDLEVQRQKLQTANLKYGDLMDRIDSARIELETARAAFKYRYTVVVAPEVPKSPKKPNVPLVALVGLLATLLLALGIPLAADLATGRLIETWQAEKRLKLPVLGEVTRV
jgi:uncharacterized protein involved in exopolysaccharide biosynthesis